MSDRYLPVATFAFVPEARIAVNMLVANGIKAILEGEEVGTLFAGNFGIGDQVRLLVPADDAPRAAALVAEAQGALEAGWEEEAVQTAVCALCGEALVDADTVCPACRSPRDGITAQPPRPPEQRIRPEER
jgi:hypothetical protein